MCYDRSFSNKVGYESRELILKEMTQSMTIEMWTKVLHFWDEAILMEVGKDEQFQLLITKFWKKIRLKKKIRSSYRFKKSKNRK